MMQDHAAGMDMCLVGEKAKRGVWLSIYDPRCWQGVGKSALVRAFAELLGYRQRTIFCFKASVFASSSNPTSR